MDRIVVAELPVRAWVGVSDEERASQQELLVDVELSLDLRVAGESDDLHDTIDYERVCRTVVEVAGSRSFHLIESFAEGAAGALLRELDVAEEVLVRVRKAGALEAWGARHAAVEIRRRRDG